MTERQYDVQIETLLSGDINGLRRLIDQMIAADHARQMAEWDDAHFFPETPPADSAPPLRTLKAGQCQKS